jgi:hypothetical protein
MPAWSHDMEVDGKKIGWNTELIKHLRSKTFPGIAAAMADQWTEEAIKKYSQMNKNLFT